MSELCNTGLKRYFDEKIGVPNVGIHSYRIFNIAYMDVIIVLLGAILIACSMKWSYIKTIIGVFIFGVIIHRLFCVSSTVDKLLFPNN